MDEYRGWRVIRLFKCCFHTVIECDRSCSVELLAKFGLLNLAGNNFTAEFQRI